MSSGGVREKGGDRRDSGCFACMRTIEQIQVEIKNLAPEVARLAECLDEYKAREWGRQIA